MGSAHEHDPIADWFNRHRLGLAIALFAVIVLGSAVHVIRDGVSGVLGFVHSAAFGGLLVWMWLGSRLDQNRPEIWAKAIVGWSVLLTFDLALQVLAIVRGNFSVRGLIPLVLVGLMLWLSVTTHRRTRRGLTWTRPAQDS